jgi:hypothetical protein
MRTPFLMGSLVLLCLLCGHLVAGDSLDSRLLLVGRWKCQIEYGSWVIQRRPNGTFEKEGELVQTLGQPPEHFTVKGRWRLKGKEYIEIWDDVSPAAWSGTKGSARRGDVLILERNRFERIQRDSPVFVETRIH